MPTDQITLDRVLEENDRKALPLQINTILITLRGEDGSGGLVGTVGALDQKMAKFQEMYYDIDKKHDMFKAESLNVHQELKKDIDGVGRKAERSIEIAESACKKVEAHILEEAKEETQELKEGKLRTDEQKFQWYHGLVMTAVGMAATAILMHYGLA